MSEILQEEAVFFPAIVPLSCNIANIVGF